MKKSLATVLLTLGLASPLAGQESKPPAMYYGGDSIGMDLAASLSQRPGFGIGRVASGQDFDINMIRRTAPAGAIVHQQAAEIHYIIEGAGVLTTGGVAVRPEAGGPASIEGGYSQRVSVGDLVLIPTGTPHQYTAVEGVVGYLEVRFQTSEY